MGLIRTEWFKQFPQKLFTNRRFLQFLGCQNGQQNPSKFAVSAHFRTSAEFDGSVPLCSVVGPINSGKFRQCIGKRCNQSECNLKIKINEFKLGNNLFFLNLAKNWKPRILFESQRNILKKLINSFFKIINF